MRSISVADMCDGKGREVVRNAKGERFGSAYLSPVSRATSETVRDQMAPPTDYIRHAARLARKLQLDAAMGGTPQPDAEFYKALSKALEEIANGLELVSKRE